MKGKYFIATFAQADEFITRTVLNGKVTLAAPKSFGPMAKDILAIFISGMVIASLLEGNLPFVAIGICGWLGNYFRERLPKQKPERLGKYLERHPILKWFTVIYLLVVASLSLKYSGELSELLMNTNIALSVLVLFFPVFVLWANEDYTLYVNSK